MNLCVHCDAPVGSNNIRPVDTGHLVPYFTGMKLFSDYRQCGDRPPASVAIGNFDGVHRGHQALLGEALDWARTHHGMPTVLTFEPHPVRVFAPHVELSEITALGERLALLSHYGIEQTLAQRFDRTFAALSPSDFAREVLAKGLNARRVIVGYDFRFGANRSGRVEDLRQLGAELGFEVHVVDAVTDGDGDVISSTAVRTALKAGAVDKACSMLGRPYHVHGVVVRGQQRGLSMGFPTANIQTDTHPILAGGVYAGWLDYGEGPRPAVGNIGHNPTFGVDRPRTCEVHVLNSSGLELYGRSVRFWHQTRIREEMRFEDVTALVAQIRTDCDVARAALDGSPIPPVLDR